MLAAGSPSATGMAKRIRVIRLPPTGSCAVRMLMGSVTRSSSTGAPWRSWYRRNPAAIAAK